MVEVRWLNPIEGGYHKQAFTNPELAEKLLERLTSKGIDAEIKGARKL